MTRRTLLSLAALLALSACGDRASGAPDRFAVDTLDGGVVLVSNPEAGAWGAAPAWKAAEDLRIGAADGDPAYLLAAPMALEVDALGRIWVLDQQTRELKVFGADGKHVRTVGRKGAGPGEFADPVGLVWAPDGTLWVFDPANARFSMFDTTGAFVRSHLRDASSATMPWPGAFDRAGRLYEPVAVGVPGDEKTVLLRYAAGMTRADTLALPAFERDEFVHTRGNVENRVPVPFSPELVWSVDRDGRLWSGVSDRYRIRVSEPGGDTVRVIQRAGAAAPVAQADVDAAEELVKAFTDQGGIVDLDRMPKTKPAFQSIRFDDRGYAWVRPSQPAGVKETAFDVFEPEGRYLGRVSIPAELFDMVPVVIRGGALYTVVLSDMGIPQVVRYRLDGRDTPKVAQRP